jgi:hypothetical protein
MLVAQIKDNQLHFIEGTYESGRDISIEINIHPGIYVVTIELNSKNNLT